MKLLTPKFKTQISREPKDNLKHPKNQLSQDTQSPKYIHNTFFVYDKIRKIGRIYSHISTTFQLNIITRYAC